MELLYCIPTYTAYRECERAVKTAMSGTMKPTRVIIIDNSDNNIATDYLTPLLEEYPVTYWKQSRNIGVAPAWNKFMALGIDYTVIANDDVFVHPYTLEYLVDAANNNSREVFFCGSSSSGNAYSLFLLKQRGYKLIGRFDESFKFAYYEDNDHKYRMDLLGFSVVMLADATYDHIGSATLKHYSPERMNQHHRDFIANQRYYIDKWGGMPTVEIYKTEFGID